MTSMDMNTTVELVRVTPGIARMWLEGNTHNRNKRDSRIDMYARDMLAGNWRVTGETIKFNGNGTLLDGQHRLEACIKAGVPFETFVVTGLGSETQEVMDSGSARRVSDHVSMMGLPHANSIAAIARLVMRYDNNSVAGVGATTSGKTATNSEVLDFVERDRNRIVRAATFGSAIRSRMHARTNHVGAAHYISGNTHTAEFEAFMMQVAEGIGLMENTPQLALRRWMERLHADHRTDALRRHMLAEFAVIIKAFNAHIEGKRASRFYFTPERESFPRMIVGDRAHLES